MTTSINRRDFLEYSAAAAAAAAGARTEAWFPKKGLILGMTPGALSLEDRMKLARDCGFQGVEVSPVSGPAEAERMRRAAESAGIRVHSVIYGGWGAPLSHPDASVRQKGMQEVTSALETAAIMGADAVLLVPAVVNAQVRYVEAWKRSQEGIKRLIPVAAKQRVLIAVEEVWNNFLLSPLEFAAYVDSFKSRWVQAYFDVGNVVRFGWPEDWIRTLGRRIRKVHIKDFKGGPGLGTGGEWVNLLEGSINWAEVRRAFMEVGFNDFLTVELGGGDEAYLRDISARVDRIIAGA